MGRGGWGGKVCVSAAYIAITAARTFFFVFVREKLRRVFGVLGN